MIFTECKFAYVHTLFKEATALSVATTLKNVITPYLLRRSKDEVQSHISLPNKTEQVLFCSLTEEQVDLYKGYLMVGLFQCCTFVFNILLLE